MVDVGLVQRVREKAHNYDRYSGCSQSVILALQEELDIGDLESFKAATVLSGGVARRGETCGALLGGLMALGLVVGREDIQDTPRYHKALEVAYEIADAFQKRLTEEYGFKKPLDSTLCRDIQVRVYGRSFDLWEPDGIQAFLDAGGHDDEGCLKVCGVAAEVTATKILELK
jgi:C_GCAxxG_C_C family probable redox protein